MPKPLKHAALDFRFDSPADLPPPDAEGVVEFAGAQIWCCAYGSGSPVFLLHGALGNCDDWGNQVPVLVEAGHSVFLIDNRGRGRSSPGDVPLSYELMADEVVAVMDALEIESAAVSGWSDGAIISLILAMRHPDRVEQVFAYAGNMDLSGARAEPLKTLAMDQAFERAMSDYARLSETPENFQAVIGVMDTLMHSQPNCSAEELADIEVPVVIAQGEFDEFIKPEHAAYLAATIPDAQLVELAGVSHFAPWQDPDGFNAALISWLNQT